MTFSINWRSLARLAPLLSMSVIGTLSVSARDRAAIPVCETWLTITQAPPTPTPATNGSVTVEFGETITSSPVCISMGPPDPSSFQFRVNGTDVTSLFSVTDGSATATAIPLAVGSNTLEASVLGHAASGDQYTQTAQATVERTASSSSASVTALNAADTLEVSRPDSIAFRVQNTGTDATTFVMACVPAANVTCLGVAPTSAHLAPNGSVIVKAAVRGDALGQLPVGLSAAASNTHSGSTQVTVVQRVILLPSFPSSGRSDRSVCPTATVAPGAAVQCGDLLYAHSLPGYRSVGRERAVTILYNSATVAGRSTVAVDYRYYPTRGAAQGIRFDVFRPGTPRRLIGRTYYAVNAGSPNMVHARLAVPVLWDSLAASPGAQATGSYPLTLSVVRKLGGTWREDLADTLPARLNVVDRRSSPFGAGWWMAGLERGYEDANGVLIAFGDGSSSYFPGPATGGSPPPGERSSLEWQHLSGYTRYVQGRRTQVRFASGGTPVAVVDTNPTRNFATYHWSSATRLDSIVDPVGRVTRFDYDGNGRMRRITGPRGDSTVLTQTVKSGGTTADLDAIRDADGFVTPFTYQGASHAMASSQARATGAVSYAFDVGSMTLDTVSAPSGVTATSRRIRGWQRVGAPASPFGSSEAAASALSGADAATMVVSWWRIAAGQTVRDTAWFHVHGTGAPTVVKLPEVAATIITRDSIGQATRVRTAGGADVVQLWDADGNLSRAKVRVRVRWTDTTTRLDSTRYEYHPVWKTLTKTVLPTGDSTRVTYDAYGRVEAVIDPLDRQTRVTYGSRGLVASVIQPHPTVVGQEEPNPTIYSYDSTGTAPTWNLRQVLKGGQGPSYDYDATGLRLRAAVDAAGNRTEYIVDDIGRPLTVSNIPQAWSSGDNAFQGAQSQQRDLNFTYDDVARVRRMTGPRQLFMEDSLDALGRVIRHCLGYNWCEKITYEDGLNPTRHERRRGDLILQSFDGAGRIASRTSKRSATGSPEDVINYGYDLAGNLTRVDNRYSRLRWRYDAWGRLRSEEQLIRNYLTDTTTFRGATFFHDYNANGQRTQTFAATAPGNPVQCSWCLAEGRTDSVLVNPIAFQQFTYYGDGSLWQLMSDFWDAGVGGWTYAYDRKGRPTQLTMPTTVSGRNYSYSYDALDREVAHRFGVSGGTEVDSLMQFDANGRVLWMRHNSAETKYVYDGLGQLRYNSAGRIPADSMRYDANGNLLRSGVWTNVYDVDENGTRGQLLYRRNEFCRIYYQHDANGNQTRSYWQDLVTCEAQAASAGEKTHASDFDAEGRMVLDTTRFRTRDLNGYIVDRVQVRRFWYDGLGRRVLQHSAATSADDHGVNRYFWMGDHVAVKVHNAVEGTPQNGHPDELWPAPSAGNPGTGRWFLYEPGMDRVLGTVQSAGTTRYFRLFYRDQHGSVMKVTDQNGTDQNEAASRYESFGAAISAPTGAEAKPGFNGLEAPGGLVYMRNRWYDPQSGRFTQEDPIGYAGGSNLYAYAGNDPITFSDPFGLKVCLKGDADQVKILKDSLSAATNSDIAYGDDNCVTGFKAREGDGYAEIQARFGVAVNSRSTYDVWMVSEGGRESTQCVGNAGCIVGVKDGTPLPHARPLVGCAWPQEQRTGLRASIAHELIGHAVNHAFGYQSGTAFNEARAFRAENLFNAASQHSARCH